MLLSIPRILLTTKGSILNCVAAFTCKELGFWKGRQPTILSYRFGPALHLPEHHLLPSRSYRIGSDIGLVLLLPKCHCHQILETKRHSVNLNSYKNIQVQLFLKRVFSILIRMTLKWNEMEMTSHTYLLLWLQCNIARQRGIGSCLCLVSLQSGLSVLTDDFISWTVLLVGEKWLLNDFHAFIVSVLEMCIFANALT